MIKYIVRKVHSELCKWALYLKQISLQEKGKGRCKKQEMTLGTTEADTGEMQPQAQEHLGPLEGGGNKKAYSPKALGGIIWFRA